MTGSRHCYGVFSAQAEVFLLRGSAPPWPVCFLRASGGVSLWMVLKHFVCTFSPRKRRCFQSMTPFTPLSTVFSAQAEVFLTKPDGSQENPCFLRASGGVSKQIPAGDFAGAFSPRKRRCFRSTQRHTQGNEVFSAQAEVFPFRIANAHKVTRFLRASGGVSCISKYILRITAFSPRKRRCF